jgi:hypothetical protein
MLLFIAHQQEFLHDCGLYTFTAFSRARLPQTREVHPSIYIGGAECLQVTLSDVTILELQNSHSLKICHPLCFVLEDEGHAFQYSNVRLSTIIF